MEEFEFDENDFIIINPMWHVVDRKGADDPNNIRVWTGRANKSKRVFVVGFTDQDLAERCISGLNDPDAMALVFPTPQKWLEFLEYLADAGHKYIAVDPEPRRPLRIDTISRLIAIVRQSIKRQEGT